MRRMTNHAMLKETLAGVLPGARVVDVGCGDGRLARGLVEAGAASAIGVECSPRQLAKARALPEVPNVRVVEGVGEALPLPDASADVVIFFNSLHHVPGPMMGAALAEAARVLAPGGVAYVCEPVAEGDFYALCKEVDDEAEVRRLAQEALRGAAGTGTGLAVEREEAYIHPIRMPDFATFRDRLVSANPERDARFTKHDARLREAWDRLGGRDADGAHTFDQPARMTLLRRA